MDGLAPSPSNPVPNPNWLTNVLLKFNEITEDTKVVEVTESVEGRLGKGNIIPINIKYNTKNVIEND